MRDQVRNILLQQLKNIVQKYGGETQVSTLLMSINAIIPSQSPPHIQYQYQSCALEIINQWYLSGVIIFGQVTNPNEAYPWINVTEFGRECLINDNLLPYDPEGYIKEITQQVPQLDEVTLNYLRESIATYNTEHLLSSAITLGVASENIILSLIESFTNSISDASKKSVFIKSVDDRGSIYNKYEKFIVEIKQYYKTIPKELSQDLEPQLDTIFNLIRLTRNQAGHPSGKTPTKKLTALNLQIFAEYSKRVFDLIDYFSKNKI